MTHLSTTPSIITMVVYSLLTFFIGPLVTRPFFHDHPDQCPAGFLLGFTVSVLLWMKYGRHMSSSSIKNPKLGINYLFSK